jgi:hypothetical protein
MDALTEARAREASFNFSLAGAVILFSAVAAIKANYAQPVTRSWAVASLTVGEMHFQEIRWHLSDDTMASYLAVYGNPDVLNVARDLDSKVESLLPEAAG